MCCWFFFFKQKTAYEMRISDWSSDVCSSDLVLGDRHEVVGAVGDLEGVRVAGLALGGGGEEGAHLCAERGLLGRVLEVHRSLLRRRCASRGARSACPSRRGGCRSAGRAGSPGGSRDGSRAPR